MERDSQPTPNTVVTLTLDTNLLLEYWKEQDRASVIEALLSLADSGEVELAVTARIREDIPRPPFANRLNELSTLHISEIGTIARFGYWLLDGNHHFGHKEFFDFSDEITTMLEKSGVKHRLPDWRDWDHLHVHWGLKRDIFLTWDKPLLSISNKLKTRFGINVVTPEAYLASRV